MAPSCANFTYTNHGQFNDKTNFEKNHILKSNTMGGFGNSSNDIVKNQGLFNF